MRIKNVKIEKGVIQPVQRKAIIIITIAAVALAAGAFFLARSPLGWLFLTTGRIIIPIPSLPFLPQEPSGTTDPQNRSIWPETLTTPDPSNTGAPNIPADNGLAPEYREETETRTDGKTTDPMKEVEQKYRPLFISLQSEYEGRLNQLVGSALAEYNQVKSSRSKTSVRQLAKKYISAGQALEAESDGRFYALLANMESDLKTAGLSTALADQLRARYITLKNERRKQILSSVRSKV
ncbi:MAG: hypothetical protein C4589_09210 [Peptococcaceae bacterium]|nr:MAG: hypothetical protein C4589_09210 [Peptococcaceae bacterium]